MNSASIIAKSSIEFGTSGARGLVENFSDELCFAFTLAFIATQPDVKKVAIAIDNRPSSPKIAQACFSALKAKGIDVVFYGVLPTPALAYAAQEEKIPAIMVTGSHIPFDRNGLKFYTASGEITKSDEQLILVTKTSVENIELLMLPDVDSHAFNLYLKRYTSVYHSQMLAGKKIGIYQHSSAGRQLYPHLFEALGAEVICLGYSDEFVPIDTEAVAESDRQQAHKWVAEHQLDALFSTDGDGDRPLLADEHGDYFTGDILCMLASKSLNIDAIATPVSCISSIEGSRFFQYVCRTKIGSPYVIEQFSKLSGKYSSVAGFEANGGFLLASDIDIDGQILKSLPTRDAVLPVLAVLSLANAEPLSNLRMLLPQRFTFSDRLKNIDKEKSTNLIESSIKNTQFLLAILGLQSMTITEVITLDGLRIIFDNQQVVHLRPSGNAPELRCYSESHTAEGAKALVHNSLNALEKYFNMQ